MEKTDNELVAEFMGFTCADTGQDRFWNPPDMPFATIYDWKYHTNHLDDFQTSWDWLMPVVEKIEKMNNVYTFDHHLQKNNKLYFTAITMTDGTTPGLCFDGESKLQSVYKAVVEFVKLYNNGKYR